jgi:hypothetical protein
MGAPDRVSLFFLSFGTQKFTDRVWVGTFEQIGFGDWFRYFTGALQICGALLLLIPRTAILGTAVLGTTMIGAMLAWMSVLGSPGSAVIPAVIFALLTGIAFGELRDRTQISP